MTEGKGIRQYGTLLTSSIETAFLNHISMPDRTKIRNRILRIFGTKPIRTYSLILFFVLRQIMIFFLRPSLKV